MTAEAIVVFDRTLTAYHDRWEPGVVRVVTSFATTEQDIDHLVRAVGRHAAGAQAALPLSRDGRA